ncbi:NADH:flavin oxidoreductase/NADH oxidase family protein [Sneathiella marina]|uniref:NADH:flavin oxidoreductase/NADH oxidase family protein n=1 Tax=Sneathiella marina TaxID=2950108 RepID=A0ABY4WB01_9PROT|nr:NADH:flavin oxidoreductase/NADH oxidase family protein [Sneathiella marina]USG61841.1 NADH:flavin oxidoreductase/NADH oxidase family protein [Sneathiella marina]
MTIDISSPLTLPCGVSVKNRIAKAPMTEGLADEMNRATARHETLYRKWAEGGAGILVTGNVQVDRRFLERPGNVVIDQNGGLEELQAFAAAGTVNNTLLLMQIGHAGRQTPRRVNPQPVAPSEIPLALPDSAFGRPRALSSEEVEDVVERFAHVATIAKETGFSGVQIHAAHGYLISEFLSPLANQRQDKWGGSLENRARLLREVVRTTRRAVGPEFPISVKLNSSDFQNGGFSHEDCLQVVKWLEQDSIDLLEISGGNYENPAMMIGGRGADEIKGTTIAREAYFLDYAANIRKATAVPLMVTGGFRTRSAMDAALLEGNVDFIGIGRPMCVDTDAPNQLLVSKDAEAIAYEQSIKPSKGALGWFCLNIIRHADGLDADTDMTGGDAINAYLVNEENTAAALVDRRLD